jgi:low temperature requirement protein LtrA
LLFIGSIFVPIPIRFYLWGIAVLISLILPFNTFRQGKKNRGDTNALILHVPSAKARSF